VLSIGAKINDLGRPKWSLHTLCQNTCAFGAHHENLNEDRPTLWRRVCTAMTLVSGNIRFMGIFDGVSWRGGVKR